MRGVTTKNDLLNDSCARRPTRIGAPATHRRRVSEDLRPTPSHIFGENSRRSLVHDRWRSQKEFRESWGSRWSSRPDRIRFKRPGPNRRAKRPQPPNALDQHHTRDTHRILKKNSRQELSRRCLTKRIQCQDSRARLRTRRVRLRRVDDRIVSCEAGAAGSRSGMILRRALGCTRRNVDGHFWEYSHSFVYTRPLDTAVCATKTGWAALAR